MKLVVAVIRPEKLEAVQAALKAHGLAVFSTSQVLGDVSEPANRMMFRGTAFQQQRPKCRLEIAVKDEAVDTAVEAVVQSAYTADSVQAGEVKLIVMPLDGCVLSVATDDESPHARLARELLARRG
jgi:nitrogen regulatory protein PII